MGNCLITYYGYKQPVNFSTKNWCYRYLHIKLKIRSQQTLSNCLNIILYYEVLLKFQINLHKCLVYNRTRLIFK